VISNEFYLLEAPATHDKVARRISNIVKFQHIYQSHAIVMMIAKDKDVQIYIHCQSQFYLSRLIQKPFHCYNCPANIETKVLLLNFY